MSKVAADLSVVTSVGLDKAQRRRDIAALFVIASRL
jgi:hypothetical protein